VLVVDKICVFYGDIQALWEVSFQVREGEIVTLVGSNGAGKTTILKTLAGILRAASGTIIFQGEDITHEPTHKIVEKGISLIPEGRKLFPRMSVYENLEMGAYSRQARSKRNETLARVFALFPILEERKNQLVGTLSGGEQQMVAIGRGLMALPRLLLIDEPSLGLAPKIVKELFQVIQEINQQGVTVLLVEQNVHQALKIAHRAYVLETGCITLEGKGTELLQNNYIKTAYLGL
jgi:branched-chain amino acid transport system ATP-binding protein